MNNNNKNRFSTFVVRSNFAFLSSMRFRIFEYFSFPFYPFHLSFHRNFCCVPSHKLVSRFAQPSCCFSTGRVILDKFSNDFTNKYNGRKMDNLESKYNIKLSNFLSKVKLLINENKDNIEKAQLAIEKN